MSALILVALFASAAAADDIEHPTAMRRLHGAAQVTGELSTSTGFPAYTYVATVDGYARITLATMAAVDDPDANGGRGWRPYLRIVSVPNDHRRGDGWSTNGQPGDPSTGHASMVIAVRRGDELTIIATVAYNITHQRAAARARYRLAVTEQ